MLQYIEVLMLNYTYLIGWTKLNTYYYGVRLANTLPPKEDLWKKYFTSSQKVKAFREEHGDPDLIKIDRTFESKQDAFDFEQLKLKQLLESGEWDCYLNQAIGFNIIYDDEMLKAMKIRMNSPHVKAHLSKKAKENWETNPKIRERHKKNNKLLTGTIWINDGIKNKRINPEDYDLKYSGWIRGRLIPKDCAFGNYDKRGENNPFYGKTHSDETKIKIRKSKMKRL